MPVTHEAPVVIYDGECFFCNNYVRLLQLKEALGAVALMDARKDERLSALHIEPAELNKGMIVLLDGRRYAGADAIYRLALLSTSNTTFNRLNRIVFRHRWLAVLLYPFLKLGRRTYLCLAGKTLIGF